MARKKKLSEEETKKQNLEFRLKRFEERLDYIPNPTYELTNEQNLSIGHLKNIKIIEKLYEGKIYLISYSKTDTNYGNPITTDDNLAYYAWMDIEIASENKESLIKNDDIHLSYSDRNIEALFHNAYFFGVDFDPEYQREYVWDSEDKIKLVDSIFNNIDIGKFVFIKKPYKEKDTMYEVLDGKQRMRAVMDFYEGKFAYKGFYYNDLSFRDRHHFLNYPIGVAEVNNISQNDVYNLFVRLNTGGKRVDEYHIEKVKSLIIE